MDIRQFEEKIYRAVTSWMWEIKLKMTKKWTNEMENGKLLWAREREERS